MLKILILCFGVAILATAAQNYVINKTRKLAEYLHSTGLL
jgi:hypothetical protein